MNMIRLSAMFDGAVRDPSFFIGSRDDMAWFLRPEKRVHVFALGDVGAMLLTGLKLLGGDCVGTIGIYDVREHVPERFEFEMNQIRDGAGKTRMPAVKILSEEELFDCDVFLFCASLRVPPVGEGGDVRMAQYEANAGLMRSVAGKAVSRGYRGLFCVVSDPVDPLCRTALSCGLSPAQVKGFGLGVMYARAAYFAERRGDCPEFSVSGRAYGPHGRDLVIANSLTEYDPEKSADLTEKAVTANLVMREWGYKPYIAPALSSGAFSILAAIRGDWHYSSSCFGEAFFGARCRCTPEGIEVENPELPEELFELCRTAYRRLTELNEKRRY